MKYLQINKNGEALCYAGWADNYFLRLRGLIGRDIGDVFGLWIKPCNQIHTCFMGHPIDAVYLSKDLEILHIGHALEPWRFFRSVSRARSVLELPAGAASRYDLQIGDRLVLTAKVAG